MALQAAPTYYLTKPFIPFSVWRGGNPRAIGVDRARTAQEPRKWADIPPGECTVTQFTTRLVLCALLIAPGFALANAQNTPSANEISAADPSLHSSVALVNRTPPQSTSPAPFSRFAIGGGVSDMGVNMQAATNLSSHLNLRAAGNFFNYEDKNISTNGFTVDAKLNFATAGTQLDYFPWARHGFRISPGVLFHNQNGMTANLLAQGGTSFSLNDYTYYSSPSHPVAGAAGVGLHKQNPAPMVTLGWGNMIPRNGSHWSFPVEIGAAYTGVPQINMALTSGQVCADPQGTVNCQNVVGDPDINANLQAQLARYQKDVKPYPFTPIVSFGVSYNFGLRKHATL